MGIKLKNNNVFRVINNMILILMIVLLPIQVSKVADNAGPGEKNIYNEIEVQNYLWTIDLFVNRVGKGYSDLAGISSDKYIDKYIEEYILDLKKDNEKVVHEDDFIEEEIYYKTDEEIRGLAIKNLKDDFREGNRILKNGNMNVEFYAENIEDGSVVTNVTGSKIEDFKANSSNEDTYEFFNINASQEDRESNKFTPNMERVVGYIGERFIGDYGYNRYYRIPKKLNSEDLLYYKEIDKETKNTNFNREIILTGIFGILFLLSAIISYKNRKQVRNQFLYKYYDLLPIDIKIISPILVIVNIFIIDWNFVKQPNNSAYIFIAVQILLLIISQLFINDIIKADNSKFNYENIKKRSIIYNIKEIFLVESTGVGFKIFMIITILSCLVGLFAYSIHQFYIVGIAYEIYEKYEYNIRNYNVIYIIGITIYSIVITSRLYGLKINTDKIVDGDYNVDIKIGGPKIVKEISENIKNIEDGFSKAVSKAVKSEKLKGELITNVSHDLKTPLTSIISYVDLLKDDNLSEENRKKYINVLDGKAQRLKILIEDLFEASKAASGSLEIKRENIDISSLLRQTLGEFQEKISTSSLEFINKWPEEKVELYLDGKKTWRIFENLISNILKYSMENSRVYIYVIKNDDNVQIVMKNISAYQLDFTEEEVIERFKRGDKSRNTEGSGLGLAIAKSLVDLQGGNLKIEIDGDLFKVILTFPLNNF